jgi:hypothetical protein
MRAPARIKFFAPTAQFIGLFGGGGLTVSCAAARISREALLRAGTAPSTSPRARPQAPRTQALT